MSIYDSEKNQMTQIEEDATKRNLENIQRVLYTTRMSNRIEPDVFHKIKMRIVQEMSAVIETTLGPYGSKILLQPKGQHGIVSYATKDGWECLNNMSYPYDDPIPHAIMFIVNDIPNSMNFHIGDGTTSGVPIVRRLYELVHEKFIKRTSHNRISPVGMTNLLNAIEEHLKENCVGLKKENEKIEYEEDGKTVKNISVDYNYNSKYIKQMDKSNIEDSMKMITRVAAVSANNDTTIANKITSLFEDKLNAVFPFVNLRLNDQEDGEDVLLKQSGFEISHGYTDDFMSNLPGGVSARYENPRFLLLSGPVLDEDLTHLKPLVSAACFGAMEKTWAPIKDLEGRPLVIVAETFGPTVIKWAQNAILGDAFPRYNNQTQGYQPTPAPLLFIKIDIQNPVGMDIFKDLEIAVGARAIDNMHGPLTVEALTDPSLTRDFVHNIMGNAKKIEATKLDARIQGGDGREKDIAEQIKFLESQLRTQQMTPGIKPSDELIYKLRTRIEMLRADMNTILVGGNSFREQRSRMSVYDDCVRAVKSTITTGGVTLGGNLAIPHYLKHNKEKVMEDVMNNLSKNKKNLAIGNNPDIVKENLSLMIDILIDGFGEAYRKVLWNAYLDDNIVNEHFAKCIEDKEHCKVFNMVNNRYETIDDYENCELLVPANTDIALMKAVLACLRQLIDTTQMIALYSLDIQWGDFVKYAVEASPERDQLLDRSDRNN